MTNTTDIFIRARIFLLLFSSPFRQTVLTDIWSRFGLASNYSNMATNPTLPPIFFYLMSEKLQYLQTNQWKVGSLFNPLLWRTFLRRCFDILKCTSFAGAIHPSPVLSPQPQHIPVCSTYENPLRKDIKCTLSLSQFNFFSFSFLKLKTSIVFKRNRQVEISFSAIQCNP